MASNNTPAAGLTAVSSVVTTSAVGQIGTGIVAVQKTVKESFCYVGIYGTYGSAQIVIEGSPDYISAITNGTTPHWGGVMAQDIQTPGSPVTGTITLVDNSTRQFVVPCLGVESIRARLAAIGSGGVGVNLFSSETGMFPFSLAGSGSTIVGTITVNGITSGASTFPVTGQAATGSSGNAGGSVTLTAGAGDTGGTGGAIAVVAGAGGNTAATGGAASLTGGAGSTSGTGGAVNITTGAGGTTGPSGAMTLTTGAVTATNGAASGAISINTPAGATGATSTAGGASGAITIQTNAGGTSGTSTGGAGGLISILAGAGGAVVTSTGTGGAGGGLTMTCGAGGGTNAVTGGAGGSIALTAGAGGNGSTASGAAGTVSIVAGAAGTGGNIAGGAVTITGGVSVGNLAGGAMTLAAGAGAATPSTGAGGVASLTGGASAGGATGNGGVSKIVGGAAASTNGSGGAAQVTGGVATGTGTGGAATIISGASGGASGVAGNATIDCGSKAGGTAGIIAIGDTNAAATYINRGTLTALQVGLTLTALGTTQSATPTSAQLLGGLLSQTGTTGAGVLTLPTGTALSAACPRAPVVGDTFDCYYYNLGGSQTITITGQTGTTVVGTAAVGSGKMAQMKFYCSGANTYNVYCIVSA